MTDLSDADEAALEEAAEAIEAVSAVEVAIAIRPRARYSLVQHAIVACVAAIAMLAFMLYGGNVHYARWQFLALPLALGIFGALLVELVPPLYRFVAPPWLRLEHVREAAYATFVERDVHATRDRTGLLVYVAARERMVELVGDIAVVKAVGIETLAAWSGALEAHLAKGPQAFATGLGALAPDLAKALPRRADDVNELANVVRRV
jgi:putative membrane protein